MSVLRQILANHTVSVLLATFRLYSHISGELRAAAFAYYALFSMVPLTALLIIVGSLFFDSSDIESAIENFAPLDDAQRLLIFSSVAKLEEIRGGVSLLIIPALMWTSLRFFQALVRAVNEAWNTEAIPWWQMPLKNVVMIAVIGSSLLLGILVPAIVQALRHIVVELNSFVSEHLPGVNLPGILLGLDLSRYVVSAIVLFYAFSLLYMLAPRRRVTFRNVWLPALIVTALLQVVQVAFVSILPRFINYSEIYGSISSLMLLLLWIYISGQIIILGGCLCAVAASPDAATIPSSSGN